MHVGVSLFFQNLRGVSDEQVWREELELADLAEPLGFGSLWSVEHHFTSYTMSPDVLQLLTYVAARTTSIRLGSMVVVLPWHDPVRVVEQLTLLDIMSGGRTVLGLGRGLGRVEFEGFRVPMDEARERFAEAAQIVLDGLEQGYVELDGAVFRQPRRDIRPRPPRSFANRTYAAAVSPESIGVVARLGVGMMVIPQKPWDVHQADAERYREEFVEIHRREPPPGIMAGWVFVDPDGDRAREIGRGYMLDYYQSVVDHYEIAGEHFARTKGYEHYATGAAALRQHGLDPGREAFAKLQIAGTPDEVIEQIADMAPRLNVESFLAVVSYGTMPHAEADRNMRCFATDVLPRLATVGGAGIDALPVDSLSSA
jgi:alkanesulfonate monooxygenase SsuD/methylene tetrahydromethanopterin reductase-like flavin-dependent oxidoreductase (luciferase family)